MSINVNNNMCPQNHACPAARVCPVQALKQEGFKAPVVDKDRCIDCKKCVMVCPMGALQVGK